MLCFLSHLLCQYCCPMQYWNWWAWSLTSSAPCHNLSFHTVTAAGGWLMKSKNQLLESRGHTDRQILLQESCAIAKITARCALYMSASHVSSKSRTRVNLNRVFFVRFLVSSKISPCSLGSRLMAFGLRAISFKDFQCGLDPPTSQTDRQTYLSPLRAGPEFFWENVKFGAYFCHNFIHFIHFTIHHILSEFRRLLPTHCFNQAFSSP